MRPLLGTWPTTQACALTGNGTGNPLVSRLALSPLSHASQDCYLTFGHSRPSGCKLLSIWGFDFLKINDVKHLFTCQLAIGISSLEKYLFRPSAHFKIVFVLSCKCSLLATQFPHWISDLQVFSPIVCVVFHLLDSVL